MKNKLKKYDKFLEFVKQLDGTKKVVRRSPFKVTRSFDILNVENQYIGSGMWLLKKLQKMDNQRTNIIGRVAENNKRIYNSKGNTNINREIADFLIKEVV